ncbi:MAG: tRNA (adenosine(37)-N6)-threonylcarbamoyltransferase complex dimerization subunit type 1 TsaB [Magnetococcales bacterium]|nr:tRNA (adenosine(37)-N6)-threonylcarbamoyltransferase complex dimerization subunit type 1 TsaB [Magnetococcales bacterium]
MTKVLALDSSTHLGGIALVEGERVIGQQRLYQPEGHAAAMPPALEQLMQQSGWRYQEIDLMVVTIGPGSFTGLRVALGLAKGIALAYGTALVAVSTLTAIAITPELAIHGRQATTSYRLVVTDARRGEVFAALYHDHQPCWQPSRYTLEQLSQALLDYGRAVPEARTLVVVGDGLPQVAALLTKALHPSSVLLHDVRGVDPVALAHHGLSCYHQRGADDIVLLEPLYLRRTTAEET